jgi:hypothetical protein
MLLDRFAGASGRAAAPKATPATSSPAIPTVHVFFIKITNFPTYSNRLQYKQGRFRSTESFLLIVSAK